MNPAAMDPETKDLLRTSIRAALAEGGDLVAALRELGWDEVVANDPAAATTILFTEQGRALGVSRALDTVVLAELPAAAGATVVVYPDAAVGAAVQSTVTGDLLEVRGLSLGPVTPGSEVLVLATRDGVPVAVTGSADELDCRVIGGFDPALGWVAVTGTTAVTGSAGAPAAVHAAVAAGRRALASELTGVGFGALQLATEHVISRRQFGHPIASFQSVRFRLAEAWTWLTGAQALVEAAWDEHTPWAGITAAMTAKAYAGQAHRDAVAHCTQVCGAMGVTWEHDLHRFVRRGFVLDTLLGSAVDLSRQHGASLLAGDEIVRIVAADAL